MSFKPMLASPLEDKWPVLFPVMLSPKIDGVRIVIMDGKPMPRSLKPLGNQEVLRALTGLPWLDGEIVVGSPTDDDVDEKGEPRNVLRRTTSGVNSSDGEPDWTLWVFDCADPLIRGRPYQDRFAIAADHVAKINHPRIKLIAQHLVEAPDELAYFTKLYVEKNYEGVMLRSLDGIYKFGRATPKERSLTKIKVWEDGEAEIVAVHEEMENTNEAKKNELGKTARSTHKAGKVGKNNLGGYTLKTRRRTPGSPYWELYGTGQEVIFNCGASANMTEGGRRELWAVKDTLLGKVVTFEYQLKGGVMRPQLPTFKGFRDRAEIQP